VQDARRAPVHPPAAVQEGAITVTLYFAAADGLGSEVRSLDHCPSPEECIAALVAELANGPVGELDRAIPPDTLVESVTLSGDTATLVLSPSFAAGLPSGSSAEMAAVYSIVNTVCRNLPQIRRVALREGEAPPRLGHLDLTDPLTPDFSLERHNP
jgi:hypothetical protein